MGIIEVFKKRKKKTNITNDVLVHKKVRFVKNIENIYDTEDDGANFKVRKEEDEKIKVVNGEKTKDKIKVKEKENKAVFLPSKEKKNKSKSKGIDEPKKVEIKKEKIKKEITNELEEIKEKKKKTTTKPIDNEDKVVVKKKKIVVKNAENKVLEKDNVKEIKIIDKQKDNSNELLYIKHLRDIIVKDINLCKEIDYDLYVLNSKLDDCYNEEDLEKQKKKLEELHKLIKELHDKYYYVINSTVYKYLEKNDNFNETKLDVDYLAKFKVDEKTQKKTKEIIEFIDQLETIHKTMENNNTNKEKELLEKKKKLSRLEKEQEIIEDVNRLTELMIIDEKNVLKGLMGKVGKVSSKKITKTKFVVDYDKLLSTPVVLSGLTARMPFLATSKLGIFLGIMGIGNAIKNISDIARFEKYEVMKYAFEDYGSLISNNIANVEDYLYIIKDSKENLKDLEKNLSSSYKKYDYNKYNDLMNKIKFLKDELDKKEKILNSMKKDLDRSKEENKKGYSLYKKMKSENK